MPKIPLKLEKKLENRKLENAFRSLGPKSSLIDFSSNDYLGFAFSKPIWERTQQILSEQELFQNGATGSRLLTGNHELFEKAENLIAKFHNSETALIFNSGFDANTGFFASVPQRGDIIIYDELCHASIREGISMSAAGGFKFRHNNLEDLKLKLERALNTNNPPNIYVVTESVFSMDGDSPNLVKLVKLCSQYNCLLVIDEAHAAGVFGERGQGLVCELDLQEEVYARIVTFGKAMGAHGAAILGDQILRDYLINFARSFIYTTALPPHSVAIILSVYEYLNEEKKPMEIEKLHRNIHFFRMKIKEFGLTGFFIESFSGIQSCLVQGNERAKKLANKIQAAGYDVKPILSPTVPLGEERLRICLHSSNSEEEIGGVLKTIAQFYIN